MVKSMDVNGDKKVTKKEFVDSKVLPADCAAWLIDFADGDCSGSITAKELFTAM